MWVHYVLDTNRYPDPISLTEGDCSPCQYSLILPCANDLLHCEGMDDLRAIESAKQTFQPGW